MKRKPAPYAARSWQKLVKARQERDWYRIGLRIYRSTMSHWVIRCSQEWLEPVFERMHQKEQRPAGSSIPW
ncbi:transposase [Schaedlerella arabinosiphila]|uniref:Transposase n=1 Tax=Schaedlerella arabinosiphila TaxID=2044587 RepID=A0A9X5C7B4_9FIRM|nr:transposase [Schaedlerella arabinosiphila]